tara:strand:+ start:9987 stop:10409 length:423 start_codon:yes stop_codon:yes gene_type:complete
MKVLYIVRGLSGSGKSSIASELVNPIWDSESEAFIKDFYSADDFFTDKEGRYNFDPNKLKEAHEECQKNVELAMQRDNVRKIAVANTFSQAWEAEPYFKLAEKHDYHPFVLECQNDFGNIHDVPQKSIDMMKERWEDRLI